MQAMAFTDATVVGITLLMLLGAVAYYLYHRIDMLERKIGLMENILLDLKVATEQTLLASSEPPERDSGPRTGLYAELSENHEQEHQYKPPTPRNEEEVFSVSNEGAREVFLDATPRTRTPPQSVQVARETSSTTQPSVSVNYEAMTYKELTALAKQRGLSSLRNASKAQVIDALRRNDNGEAPLQLSDNQSVISGGTNLRTLDLSSFVTQTRQEQIDGELKSAEPELELAPLDAAEAEPVDDSFVRSS
jgi:hypothetical protein